MKHFLISVLVLLSLNIFGQMRRERLEPEVKAGCTILASTFAVNETMMHLPAFQSMTEVDQYQLATKVYITGALTSGLSYFLIKYFRENKYKIKRKLKCIF